MAPLIDVNPASMHPNIPFPKLESLSPAEVKLDDR